MDVERVKELDVRMGMPIITCHTSRNNVNGIARIVWTTIDKSRSYLSLYNFMRRVGESASRVETIRIVSLFEAENEIIAKRVERLMRYQFPKVSTLIVGNVVSQAALRGLLQQCPHVRHLQLRISSMRFDDAFNLQKLESITMYDVSSASFESLIQRCPKLQRVTVEKFEKRDDYRILIDVIMREKPTLDSLDVDIPMKFSAAVDALCELKWIRRLGMKCFESEEIETENPDGQSIVVSNPAPLTENMITQMTRELKYVNRLTFDTGMLDPGAVAAIAGFESLTDLTLRVCERKYDVEAGLVRLFSMRPHLRTVDVQMEVSQVVIMAAVENCILLKEFRLVSIEDTNEIEEAATFVRRLSQYAQSHLVISMEYGVKDIWHSDAVREELAALGMEPESSTESIRWGRSIKISFRNEREEFEKYATVPQPNKEKSCCGKCSLL